MDVVKFPALNLELKVSKVAFSLFSISIYKYAVCIVLGIVVALILCKIAKENFDIKYNDVLIATVIGIIVGTIGARIYFVLFNLDYYAKDISKIFDLRSGGLAIYGGLILGGLAIFAFCKLRKINTLNFFDYTIPYVAIAQAIGRWGNFFNIEAYGVETKSFLRMGIDTVNGYMEVHPAFLYESIALIIIFAILRVLQKNRKFDGEILAGYGVAYGFVRFLIEGIRADSLMLFSLRISQVISLIVFIASLAYIIYEKRKMSKKV